MSAGIVLYLYYIILYYIVLYYIHILAAEEESRLIVTLAMTPADMCPSYLATISMRLNIKYTWTNNVTT